MPVEGSLARSRAYLVKCRLIESFRVYILSMPVLLGSCMTSIKHSRFDIFKESSSFQKLVRKRQDLRESQKRFLYLCSRQSYCLQAWEVPKCDYMPKIPKQCVLSVA